PKTPASSQPSADRSHNAAPLPAGSAPQSEPHNEPEHRAPPPSSPGLCRFPTKAICCRIFTPAQPDCPAASMRHFCSGAYTSSLLEHRALQFAIVHALAQDMQQAQVLPRDAPARARAEIAELGRLVGGVPALHDAVESGGEAH